MLKNLCKLCQMFNLLVVEVILIFLQKKINIKKLKLF